MYSGWTGSVRAGTVGRVMVKLNSQTGLGWYLAQWVECSTEVLASYHRIEPSWWSDFLGFLIPTCTP